MGEIECAGKTINVDSEGFLADLEDWDENVARELALREGLKTLTDEKVEIIKFMRDYYKKFNTFPILSHLCRVVHQPRGCVNEEFINPEKAWKIAGLPKLSGIHFVSMDGKHYLMEECC